jgi:5'-3' exonuclease
MLFSEENITLLDVSGLLYRSQFAQQAQSINSFCGNAAAGPLVMLLSSIMKIVREFSNPIFVLDSWPKRKIDLYSSYKASRKVTKDKDPEGEAKKAMRTSLRNAILQYVPTVIAIHPDEEADDVIASLSTQLSIKSVNVKIISLDKDLWQLLDNRVRIFTSDSSYSEIPLQKVQETFGCPKEKIPLYKTWLGDLGDDVPKVSRLPIKLALELINSSIDFEDSIKNIPIICNTSKLTKWRDAMIAFIPQARINWELVNAKRDLEVGFAYFRANPDTLQEMLDLYKVQGFTANEFFHTLIPHQDNTLRILNQHGFLKKILKFEEIYKNP